MNYIGEYRQLTDFTMTGAGTSQWCKARKNEKLYFIKKFHAPVYPAEELGLPEKQYNNKLQLFHRVQNKYTRLYSALSYANTTSHALVVPENIIIWQYHLCTISEFVESDLDVKNVCTLPIIQRLDLMYQLVCAVISVHNVGIVHSDLKPENLILQLESSSVVRLRLIDFDGSFFANDPPLDAEAVKGDMGYWPPEVFALCDGSAVRLNYQMDSFAVGLLLHYFWCGTLPEKPKGQYIGVYLLNDGSLKLDPSMPETLRKTIQGLLNPIPEKRIDLNIVRGILERLLKSTIPTPKEKTVQEEPRPIPEPPKVKPKVTTMVLYKDKSGIEIAPPEIVYISQDSSQPTKVAAKTIPGYTLSSDESVLVRCDKTGKPSQSTVTFYYKKYYKFTDLFKKYAIAVAAAIIVLYSLGMYILIGADMNSGKWGNAKNHMSMAPLYSVLFHRQADEINYNYAKEHFDSGNYWSALLEFRSVSDDYGEMRDNYIRQCEEKIKNR